MGAIYIYDPGVYIFHGPLSGASVASDADGILLGDHFSEQQDVLAGGHDLDGDGHLDLVAAMNGWDSYTGRVAVLGGASLVGSGSLLLADTLLTGDAPGDSFGETVVSPGDLDGDGLGDLLIGASGTDAHGSNSGTAYLFYGGLPATVAAAEADATWEGDEENLSLGSALAGGGDLTGDGILDLALGALSADGDEESTGGVFVVPGT